MDFLLQIDAGLFDFIYYLPHPPLLNHFFNFLSGVGSWGLIWIIILVLLIAVDEVDDKRDLFTVILSLIITILSVDIVIKNIFRRARPDVSISEPIVFLGRVSSYSFPSSHAAFAFAGAYILSRKHKKGKIFYYLLAMLIAFSRIYLGKHFPIDVVVGSGVGMVIGYISVELSKKIK
ncbi:phosphatase PAP2 family protein, partial [Candidatus Gottesmanbacteria bacterium]|nr:phosphatase PAP2 family protein [Candidatus Gottesmanbacteria bacterium]